MGSRIQRVSQGSRAHLHYLCVTSLSHTERSRAVLVNSDPTVKRRLGTSAVVSFSLDYILLAQEQNNLTPLTFCTSALADNTHLHFQHGILTSSHLMNLPPFFSASWTDTGLSCNAWTPGLAPAMARDSLPGCQRLNPGYGELDSSEGTKRSSFRHFHSRSSFFPLFSGERVNWRAERRARCSTR